MPENDNIYRPDCDTISLNELYKRVMEIGLTYFGNVTDIGYVEAPSGYAIKVYHNEKYFGTHTIGFLCGIVQNKETPEEWRKRKEKELDAMITTLQYTMAATSFDAEIKLSLSGPSLTQNDSSKFRFDRITEKISLCGSALGLYGGLRYTGATIFGNGFWRGVNGNYYSLAQAQKGAQGWVMFQNSANIAKGASKLPRWGGNVAGWATTVYSAYRFFDDPNWEDGLDTVFGGVGIYYWPVGVVYFGGKGFCKGMINYTQTMIDNGLTPGVDDMSIWK